jgi:hypothetical protein
MLLAVVGLLIVAFATTRMAFLERKLRRTSVVMPSRRHPVKSTA